MALTQYALVSLLHDTVQRSISLSSEPSVMLQKTRWVWQLYIHVQ